MTNDELIAKAREHVKAFEERSTYGVTLDMLPKVRVLDAVVVYFEGKKHGGRIEVFLKRESGELITATWVPPKKK